MILRLILAFTRWVWGVSPAFVVANSDEWYLAMYFGVCIDIAAVAMLVVMLKDWMQSGGGRRGK